MHSRMKGVLEDLGHHCCSKVFLFSAGLHARTVIVHGYSSSYCAGSGSCFLLIVLVLVLVLGWIVPFRLFVLW